MDLDVIQRALTTFESIYDELRPAERQELLRLLVRRVRVGPSEIEVEVFEGGPVLTRVDGLRRSPRRKGASGPKAKGTEYEGESLELRARCVLAPAAGLEPATL